MMRHSRQIHFHLARGFTLIELLIVVAIIAILAAIAVPNFMEAQTRSKTARAKADLRSIATALEAYATDNNEHYPPDQPRPTLAGYLSAPQLSTPISYISSIKAVIDPFRRDFDLVPADADEVYRFWNLAARNEQTPTAASRNGFDQYGPWVTSSAGPDRRDQYPATGDHLYETFSYDPTNGTSSAGDLIRSHRNGQS